MQILGAYYQFLFGLIAGLIANGHWWMVVLGAFGVLGAIALFFVILGAIGERMSGLAGAEGGGRGGGFLLIVVVIIGILASVAVPQFAMQRDRADVLTAAAVIANVRNGFEAYWIQAQQLPTSLDQAGLDASQLPAGIKSLSYTPETGEVRLEFARGELAGKSISLVASLAGGTGDVQWTCTTDVDPNLLPDDLRADCSPADAAPTPEPPSGSP